MANKNITEVNAMGLAFEDDGEANELFAYMSNQAATYRNVERCYRYANIWQSKGEFVPEYLEAKLLLEAVNDGAMAYCREYCTPLTKMRELFSFEARRNCAKMLVAHFISETEAEKKLALMLKKLPLLKK